MNSELIIDQTEKIFKIENEEETINFRLNTSSLINNNNNYLNTNNSSLTLSTSSISKDLNQDLIEVSQTKIIIKSLSSEFICFRVKTTKKKYYVVSPCYYILSPNEILNIKISFYINPTEEINPKGHKFKFEGFIIPKEEKNHEAKKLFLDYISQLKKVKGYAIKKLAKFINKNDEINLNNFDEDKIEDKFEDLKIEYCKLKGINENLKIEYMKIKKRMELEIKEKNNKCVKLMQFKYDIDINNKNQPFTKNIYFICFIVSVALGFFLMK